MTAINAAFAEWQSRASTVITRMWSGQGQRPRTACVGCRGAPSNSLTAIRNGRLRASKKSAVAGAVLQPPDICQNNRADRATDQVVPHEPEPALAERAEQVEHQVLIEGDAAEVHFQLS